MTHEESEITTDVGCSGMRCFRFRVHYVDALIILAVTGALHALILVPLLIAFGWQAYTAWTETAVAASSGFLATVALRRYRAMRRRQSARRTWTDPY